MPFLAPHTRPHPHCLHNLALQTGTSAHPRSTLTNTSVAVTQSRVSAFVAFTTGRFWAKQLPMQVPVDRVLNYFRLVPEIQRVTVRGCGGVESVKH